MQRNETPHPRVGLTSMRLRLGARLLDRIALFIIWGEVPLSACMHHERTDSIVKVFAAALRESVMAACTSKHLRVNPRIHFERVIDQVDSFSNILLTETSRELNSF